MSLLKQKKEKDRITAEAAAKEEAVAKAKAEAKAKAKAAGRAKAKAEAEQRKLTIHPVFNKNYGRDTCDAYFYGLVFAAIADDEKVDSEELVILNGVAKSMNLGECDVDDAIALIAKMSVDDKLRLIEECVCAVKDHESIVKLFYAQFAELWMTGEYDLAELKDYAVMFKGWTGVEFSSEQLKDLNAVVSNSAELNSALDDLSTWMGISELKYFVFKRYGDVTNRVEQSQAIRRDAEEAANRKVVAENILHVFQSEIVYTCAGWGSLHYEKVAEWIAQMKLRMSTAQVELLDFEKEVNDALNGYWCDHGDSIYRMDKREGKRCFTFGKARCVYTETSDFWYVEWRKKLGMIIMLLICRYDMQGNSYDRWGLLDDIFRSTYMSINIEKDVRRFVEKEFGIDEDKNEGQHDLDVSKCPWDDLLVLTDAQWMRLSDNQLIIINKRIDDSVVGVDSAPQMVVVRYTKEIARRCGNPESLNALGRLYMYGNREVAKNYAEAFKWYSKSAEKQDAEGLFRLGVFYDKGHYVEKDPSKAAECFLMAAKKGHASACNNLAVAYHTGEGVVKNWDEAWKWYLKAAELGCENSQIEVAEHYESGDGVALNQKLALKWWRKAAEKESVKAQMRLGDIYWAGEGVDKCEERAFEWWEAAAYNGDSTAMGNVGFMYYHGIGVEKDVDEAKHWLTKAAEAGNEKSKEHLKEYWGC